MENYIDVVGYEGRYKVSDLGNIKSMPKPKCKREKILKQCNLSSGYKSVDLGDGVSIKKYLVHRLVAQAFIPNHENKPQVNHINGKKYDNRLQNLEWNTRSENQKHSIIKGLRSAKGEKNSQSILTEEKVLEIRHLLKGKIPQKLIADRFGISIPTVSDINRRHTWTHI